MILDHNDLYLSTELALGADRARTALDAFVAVNPHLAGIKWADVLDNMINYDAQLDVTEAYDPIPGIDGRAQACATLSLWWVAGGHAPDIIDIAALAAAAQAVTAEQLLAWIQQGGWS